MFYFSLKARGHGGGWKGGGFAYPGTLLDGLRGQYSLAANATSLVRCEEEARGEQTDRGAGREGETQRMAMGPMAAGVSGAARRWPAGFEI